MRILEAGKKLCRTSRTGRTCPATAALSGFAFLLTRQSRAVKSTPTILAKRENFTSEASAKRLHKRPKGASSQARLPDFGEDVKKSLRLLSEVRLTPREVKPCGFVRHFLSIKNGGPFSKPTLPV